MNDLNQFKNNGFLVKKNLINQKEINKINKIVNEIISKEKIFKSIDSANMQLKKDLVNDYKLLKYKLGYMGLNALKKIAIFLLIY
mgnify:CR=1 FL=1